MPQKRNNPEPPKPMTWSRAAPILALCVIFDALRFMFNMFWFFGPALAALACTIAGSNTTLGSLVGTTATAAACGTAAGAVGFFGAVPIQAFGVIMAMAVGLIGWLTIFLIQLLRNIGIFKENFSMVIRLVVGLLISEIPIINALPSLTIINITMFNIQIKHGREAVQKWEKENAEAQQQTRNQQMAQLMQSQAIQQQAANDELYAQQAGNEEIPEEERKAA